VMFLLYPVDDLPIVVSRCVRIFLPRQGKNDAGVILARGLFALVLTSASISSLAHSRQRLTPVAASSTSAMWATHARGNLQEIELPRRHF
jgi:hypothetical protein